MVGNNNNPVINSFTLPMDGVAECGTPEEYKRGSKNILWLTVREGRTFILKGLIETLRMHPEEVARLRKEYSLGLRINHQGVAGVYGFETHPEVGPVIVMEYIDGVTLDHFLNDVKSKPTEVRLKIACRIADALSHIHSLGISHRDLKPDNILITKRNEAKLIDLGLGDSEDAVIYKQSLGTTEFGAPEQQEPFPADSRADVYSFGMVLKLLLPEKRFRKLRKACLAELPYERLTMQEVSESLSGSHHNKAQTNAKRFATACIALLIIGTGGYFAFTLTKQRTTQPYIEAEVKSKIVNSADSKEVDVSAKEAPQNEEEKAKELEKMNTFVGNLNQEEIRVNGNVPDKSSANIAVPDYEAIYNKYLTKALKEIEELGPGINHKTGEYEEEVITARATKLPFISNQLIEELTASDCPYDEMSRLAQLFFDEIQKASVKIDSTD